MLQCKSLNRCLMQPVATFVQANLMLDAGGVFGVPSCQTVVNDVVQSKKSANRRDEYTKSLAYYLSVFIKGWEALSIDQINSTEIEKRLFEIAGDQSDNSRQTWFTRVNTMFAYAKRRGIIKENPCDRLERISVDRKEPPDPSGCKFPRSMRHDY